MCNAASLSVLWQLVVVVVVVVVVVIIIIIIIDTPDSIDPRG